jgi:protein-tyrosine phosphatase
MQKILMVCLGNICRSPLAEGVMLKLIQDHQLSISVDSAGTSGFHVGENPDHRTIQNAKLNGVNLSQLIARQFSVEDFDYFDKIYVMDKNNYRNVLSLARDHQDSEKVDLFLNLIEPGKNMEVPDPYYGGEEGFEQVFQLIKKACYKLAGLE